MKKLLYMLLAALLPLSLSSVVSAVENQEAYEENGFTITYTDDFNQDNMKGCFLDDPLGKIEDGLYVARFIYYAMPMEELESLLEKDAAYMDEHDGQLPEDDKTLLRSKQGSMGELYAIDYTEISDANKAKQESLGDTVTELATVGDVVFYRIKYEESESTQEYLAGIEPEYQEEYRSLQAALNDAMTNAEFYTPIIRGEDLVGKVISFETTDLDGNPVKSEDIFKEHEITMVNLWATWCHNCIDEMTGLGEMAGRLAEKNVALVGICTDADDELDLCKEILKKHNVDYLNMMPIEDQDDIFDWNGSLPTSYFIGKDGTVLCMPFRGAPDTMDEYENIINALLKGETVEPEEPDTPHAAANDEGVYRVIVSDSDGNMVEGVGVQFCSDTTCSMGKTDEKGVAVFSMEEGPIYTVHVLKVPEGYVKNAEEYKTVDTYCDVCIALDKVD